MWRQHSDARYEQLLRTRTRIFRTYSGENDDDSGSASLRRPDDGEELLDSEEHRWYRRAVGKLQWEVPIRPDIAYATKELARFLQSQRTEDLARLKHVLKYAKGTSDYRFVLRPETQLSTRPHKRDS